MTFLNMLGDSQILTIPGGVGTQISVNLWGTSLPELASENHKSATLPVMFSGWFLIQQKCFYIRIVHEKLKMSPITRWQNRFYACHTPCFIILLMAVMISVKEGP